MAVGFEGSYPAHRVVHCASIAPSRKGRSHKPRRSPKEKLHPAPARKRRPLRCDCGQVAVTVISVRVGLKDQYIIHLPLCRDCLALERAMHDEE